jgi:transposase InsO family protein
MDEQRRRTQAIALYLQGTSPGAICEALGRSRPWFYKWLKAYDPSNPAWGKGHSRAPKRLPTRTGSRIVELVCSIRQRLVKAKYSQKGAVAIQWELQRLRVRPLPAIWTINRILKRQGLLVKPTYQPRITVYPALQPTAPNVVHQMDLVGPRYLSKERFYGVHLIDAFSNAVALAAAPSKRDSDIVEAVVGGWQRLGIPDLLQVDNELSFRGSNRYPRSFGLLIRLCLYLGIEIVFIPPGQPWRNGIVEKFNDVYGKLFFRASTLKTWATCSRNCGASKASIIARTAILSCANAPLGASIPPTGAVYCLSPLSFITRASHGVMARSPLSASPTTPVLSSFSPSALPSLPASFMNTSREQSLPNLARLNSTIVTESFGSIVTTSPKPDRTVNDLRLQIPH